LSSILSIQKPPSCPLDRTPFDPTLKTVAAFPTNLLVQQLLEEKPQSEFKLCETHKEPLNLICLTDKCAVCKYCVEYGNHKGHEINHYNDMKNEATKKKQELEEQLKGFDKEFQPVYNLIRTQKEKSKALIKEKFAKLTSILAQKEAQLKAEVDGFFSENKIRIDDKLEENFALKQLLMTRISILDNMAFDEEFLKALIGNDNKDFGIKNECESVEGKVNELKTKLESSLEEIDQTITSSLDNCKPVPPREKVTLFTAHNSPNLFFYQDKSAGAPSELYLKEIHEKWLGDYDTIATNSTLVIQWIFPNFFRSRVNPHASKLQEHEAETFRTDLEISQKLVKSYSIFLDFFGLKMSNLQTGELTKTDKWQKRYEETFVSNKSDFVTVRRILTFLNNVGLRKYAIQFVNFMEKEIYGEIGGYKKFKTIQNAKSMNKSALANAPLKKLAADTSIFEIMSIYGDHHNDPQKIKELEENCFCKYPDGFQDSVYFQGNN